MCKNRGFDYESVIYNICKINNILEKGFIPAGSDANSPDCRFVYKKKSYNLELKLDQAADYGQIELRYNAKSKVWSFGGKNEELKQFYIELGILDKINLKWKNKIPKKQTIDSNKFTWKDAKCDYENFKDFFIDVPIDGFFNHYAKKDTYYIQIGSGYGFYYMKKDIANLKVEQFNASMQARVRIKRRTSSRPDGYGFLVALKIKQKAKPSIYNIEQSVDFLY